MEFPLLLGVVLLANPLSAARQDVFVRREAPLEFKAECTFTVELVDQMVAELSTSGGDERIAAMLREHECEHGWALDSHSPDFVDPAHAARCSDAVLDRLAVMPLPVDWNSLEICDHFAMSLQRAGQLDRALHLIDSVGSGFREQDKPAVDGGPGNYLLWSAYKLCERAGRHDLALGCANRCRPLIGCSVSVKLGELMLQGWRARQLLELGRVDEAWPIAWELASEGEPEDVCLWIDCEISSGRCADSASALRMAGERAGGGAWDSGKRLHDLRRATRATQLDNLSELARLDQNFALSLVFGFKNSAVSDHLDAFDVIERQLRDKPLADVLAATGNPAIQPMLERAEQQRCVDIEYAREIWEKAHRRWIALSQGH